jgi:glutaredoxin
MATERLNLYGADWCTKTALLKNFLQSEWIEFDYHNVDLDEEAAEKVKSLFEGKLKFPTITHQNNFLKNPSIGELRAFLKRHQIE